VNSLKEALRRVVCAQRGQRVDRREGGVRVGGPRQVSQVPLLVVSGEQVKEGRKGVSPLSHHSV
jgi:hypothetical protein